MRDSLGEHTFDYQSVSMITPVRSDPSDDAEQVTQALPGEPLRAGEMRDGWVRVHTAYDYAGWLRAAALDAEADASWLEPRSPHPLAYAMTLLGAPYLWGGMTERGVDCSGLVHMSFRASGRLVPRDAAQQEGAGTPVGAADLRCGDLVSYGDADGADHIAFWLGNGRILHSTHREGVDGVVEEVEPLELRARRRVSFRL